MKNLLRVHKLETERNKLYFKALKLFPNSPQQMKVRKKIDLLNIKIKKN
jgi:hypothetical protein